MKKYRLRLTAGTSTGLCVTCAALPPRADASPGAVLKSLCKESQ